MIIKIIVNHISGNLVIRCGRYIANIQNFISHAFYMVYTIFKVFISIIYLVLYFLITFIKYFTIFLIPNLKLIRYSANLTNFWKMPQNNFF